MPKRAGRKSKAQTPAPRKERIYGSKKNPKGSAASEKSASKIKLDEKTMTALKNKLKEFKEKHPNKKNITLNDLKAVYRRGAGAYSKSHRPTITGGAPNTRNAWSMARVNKFLLKAGGTKVKAAYVQDDDLMKMAKGGEILGIKYTISKGESDDERIVTFEEGQYRDIQIEPHDAIFHKTWGRMGGEGWAHIKEFGFTYPTIREAIKSYLEDKRGKKYPIVTKKKGGITLLAPNGKPSNLNSEQWHLVRTPQFKAWFGDWENDPQNASKVLDENGEPLVVYHGSDYVFNVFKTDKQIYFATNKEYASEISESGRVKSFFINIRNLLDATKFYIDDYSHREYKTFLKKNGIDVRITRIDNENVSKFWYLISNSNVWKSIKEKYDGFSMYENMFATKGKIEEEDFDDPFTKVYVCFEANQIKLADGSNITFDVSNPDIRYAKGGLIAPNGKPSNLTPEQYKLVRTPQFKAWFGDWENDPNNASKVVDENGEPLVMWHKSTSIQPFFEFDKKYINKNDPDFWSNGFWFSRDIENTAAWTMLGGDGFVRSFFLNVRNILKNDKIDEYEKAYEDEIEENDGSKNRLNLIKRGYDGVEFEKIINPIPIVNQVLNRNEKIYIDRNTYLRLGKNSVDDSIYHFIQYGQIIDYIYFDTYDGKKLEKQTLDYQLSIIEDLIKEGVIIVFESNQIKLADGTNTTFDPILPDSRFAIGGSTDEIITCKNCGWSWNESQTTPSEKYICHNCGFDNEPNDDYAKGGQTFNDKELLAKWKRGESIGFTATAHLKAKGLIPRSDGEKRKSPQYKRKGGLIGGFEDLEDEWLSKKIEIFLDKVKPIKYYFVDPNTNTLTVGFDKYYSQDAAQKVYEQATSSKEFFHAPSVESTYDSKTGDLVFKIKLKKPVEYGQGGEVDEKVIRERWAKKKDSLMNMADNIRSLRTNLRKDLKGDDDKDRLTALAISLMDKTAERVGNDESEANGHLGITGLSKRNVKVEGNTITLKYIGKSGVKQEKQFSDEGIASALKDAIANSQSKYVFETSDGFRIKNDRINRYLNEYDISAKDLRGYSANQWIVSKLREVKDKEILGDEAKRKKKFNEIVKSVAEKVGHGAPTLKKHYMLPSLEREWVNNGKIVDLAKIKRAFEDGGVINYARGGSPRIRMSEANEIKEYIKKQHEQGKSASWSNNNFQYVARPDGRLLSYDSSNGKYKFYEDVDSFIRALYRFQNRGYKRGGDIGVGNINVGTGVVNNIDYDHLDESQDIPNDGEGVFDKGGALNFNDIVLYHEKNGNYFVPKNTVYAWLYQDPNAAKKLESGEFDFVLFPPNPPMSLAMSRGYVPPLLKIWTKKYQKETKGADNLLGIVKGWYDEENKKLYIIMMTTRKDMRRKGVNSHIIKNLREEFKLDKDQIIFDKPTKEGEMFSKSGKYEDGGDIYLLDVNENIQYAKGGNVPTIEVEKIDKDSLLFEYDNKGHLILERLPYSSFNVGDYADKEGLIKELKKYGIDKGEKVWSIKIVQVKPRYRGQGVASTLLSAAIQWAKENDYEKLVLVVQAQVGGALSNEQLYELYSKFKFKPLRKTYGVNWMARKLDNGGEVDLFEHYDELPQKVQAILEKYENEEPDYTTLESLQGELEEHGYTFDYGLDYEPYGLRKMEKGGELVSYPKRIVEFFDRENKKWIREPFTIKKGQLIIYNHSDGGDVEAKFLGKSGDKAKIEILDSYSPWTRRVEVRGYVNPAGRTEPDYYLNQVPRGTKKTVSVNLIEIADDKYYSYWQKPISRWLRSPEFKEAFGHLDNPTTMAKGGEISDEDKKETYKKWKSLVNMSKSELEKFYNSEEGKVAGLTASQAKSQGIDSGRESARWIMKMKDTSVKNWTPTMWKWAKKQISFISRMSGNKGKLYDESGAKTRKHTSLLIWGHNPTKKAGGGELDIPIKENAMNEVTYNQLPAINDLGVGKKFVLKEHYYNNHNGKPTHQGCRYLIVENMGDAQMSDCLKLKVHHCYGGGGVTTMGIITRPIKNIMNKGRDMGESLASGVEKAFKKGGELDPDKKEVKQYFEHKSGAAGGLLVGKRHSEGGIQAINKSTGQPLEMEGGEVVITRDAVSDSTLHDFNGKQMTNREILSAINESGGGVKFAEGGDVSCLCSGKEYKLGGKTYKDYELFKKINNSYGSKSAIEKGMKVEDKEHGETFRMLKNGEITYEQFLKKLVVDHLSENPKYYDK